MHRAKCCRCGKKAGFVSGNQDYCNSHFTGLIEKKARKECVKALSDNDKPVIRKTRKTPVETEFIKRIMPRIRTQRKRNGSTSVEAWSADREADLMIKSLINGSIREKLCNSASIRLFRTIMIKEMQDYLLAQENKKVQQRKGEKLLGQDMEKRCTGSLSGFVKTIDYIKTEICKRNP